MLDYDESAPLNLNEVGVEERDGATIRDVTFDSPGAVVSAYVVEPAASGATPAATDRAGIVFFHWLETGSPTSNRTEFLPDAATLAQEGVVSVLVQGEFPWLKNPTGLEADQAAVVTEALKVRRGIDLLLARADVDPARVAVVGHDYGAMYAILLAGVDPRPKAFVLMAATPHHADWNIPFWLAPGGLDEAGQAAYSAGMAPLDPLGAVATAAPAALLFQFARADVYIPESTALEFYAAASEPKRLELFDAEHPLNDEATASRMVWLRGQLGL
jgi:dienelactone hydrolase